MASMTVHEDDLHYDDLGDREGPVAVWGHGFILAASFFQSIVDVMHGYRHILLDFRGHGRSAGVTSDPTLSRMADDTWEIVQRLGIEHFAYVGHSMGSAVGVRLAARHPRAIKAGVGLAPVQVAGNPDVNREVPEGLISLAGDPDAMASALAALFARGRDEVLAKEMGDSAALVHKDVLRTIAAHELFIDESADILPHLDQPWFFIDPGDDLAIQPDHQLEWSKRVPGSRILWLAGEGHVFPQEIPGDTAIYVEAFLRSVA